jgi:hypothetical protein
MACYRDSFTFFTIPIKQKLSTFAPGKEKYYFIIEGCDEVL